jgi:F-type H+-transporting ATPase subunit b
MPQLDVSTYLGQLFWLFMSFFFLWFVLHTWLVPRFLMSFEKRRKHIEQLLEKAATLQAHAENVNRQAQERLEQVRTQAEHLIKQTMKEAELEKYREQETCAQWLREEREKTVRVVDEIRQKALQDLPSLVPSLGADLFNHFSKRAPAAAALPQDER